MQIFPSTESKFIFPGTVGNLEVWTTPNENQKNATAIICHPHPLHGGTMTNKVVTTLARTFSELGLRTVRFNFRGVGKSEGEYDAGIGETNDLLALVKWVKTVNPQDEIWLAGFSFGGFVAARAAVQISPAQLVTVAPQVSRFIEDKLPPITVPWILVQGEQDDVVSPQEVFAWIETLNPKPVVIRMPDAGHFFHGKLTELRMELLAKMGKV